MSKNFSAKLIAQSYQDRFGGTMAHAEEVVYFLQELIQQELYRGNPVNLPMVGKFHPYLRKGRMARNPKTGEAVKVEPQQTVKFKVSKKMKAWLSKNRKA